MITVYGIPACNTVKKALDWLKAHNVPFTFHDYKKKGVSPEQLQAWNQQVGYTKLVNTKGTTWRGLDEATRTHAATEQGALQLMREKTSVIKRPLIEKNGKVVALGFDEAVYSNTLLQP